LISQFGARSRDAETLADWFTPDERGLAGGAANAGWRTHQRSGHQQSSPAGGINGAIVEFVEEKGSNGRLRAVNVRPI
jgi:hypothetical protein